MLLVALLSLLSGCTALRLVPGAFLKLPDSQGVHRFNAGTASGAAYDELTKILYVVGESVYPHRVGLSDNRPVHTENVFIVICT